MVQDVRYIAAASVSLHALQSLKCILWAFDSHQNYVEIAHVYNPKTTQNLTPIGDNYYC